MTLHACVLAKVTIGSALAATEYMATNESVGLVVPTAGPHDLLILVKAADASELGKIVVNFLQNAPGVTSTLTLLILEDIIPFHWLKNQLSASIS